MSRLRVTDHAVVRYLERVRGVDVAAIRRQIEETVRLAAPYPGASAVYSGGFEFRIADGAVVTVHPRTRAGVRSGRQRWGG